MSSESPSPTLPSFNLPDVGSDNDASVHTLTTIDHVDLPVKIVKHIISMLGIHWPEGIVSLLRGTARKPGGITSNKALVWNTCAREVQFHTVSLLDKKLSKKQNGRRRQNPIHQALDSITDYPESWLLV